MSYRQASRAWIMCSPQEVFQTFIRSACLSFFWHLLGCLSLSLPLCLSLCGMLRCSMCWSTMAWSNKLWFLMTADNTTDETDGVWIYSAVTSFEQRNKAANVQLPLFVWCNNKHAKIFLINFIRKVLLEHKPTAGFCIIFRGYICFCTFLFPITSHCDLLRCFLKWR